MVTGALLVVALGVVSISSPTPILCHPAKQRSFFFYDFCDDWLADWCSLFCDDVDDDDDDNDDVSSEETITVEEESPESGDAVGEDGGVQMVTIQPVENQEQTLVPITEKGG